MHRIIEAFTRPHCQVSAIDELICLGVIVGVALCALAIWFVLDIWSQRK